MKQPDFAASEGAQWSAESYRKVHKFTPTEQYMVQALSRKPSLSAGLDALFRKNPKRWHQVVAAAMLTRREADV